MHLQPLKILMQVEIHGTTEEWITCLPFFFGSTGAWTQDLMLAKLARLAWQVLYHLRHSASPRDFFFELSETNSTWDIQETCAFVFQGIVSILMELVEIAKAILNPGKAVLQVKQCSFKKKESAILLLWNFKKMFFLSWGRKSPWSKQYSTIKIKYFQQLTTARCLGCPSVFFQSLMSPE
jgi:hypothetical protein